MGEIWAMFWDQRMSVISRYPKEAMSSTRMLDFVTKLTHAWSSWIPSPPASNTGWWFRPLNSSLGLPTLTLIPFSWHGIFSTSSWNYTATSQNLTIGKDLRVHLVMFTVICELLGRRKEGKKNLLWSSRVHSVQKFVRVALGTECRIECLKRLLIRNCWKKLKNSNGNNKKRRNKWGLVLKVLKLYHHKSIIIKIIW